MRRRSPLVVVVATLLVVAAWVPGGSAAAAEPPQRYLDDVFTDVTSTLDIPYGAARDEFGQIQELNLDLYEPVGDAETRRPAVILAHGGSFVSGSKATMADEARGYARRGFVALSMEYRMVEAAGPVRFPPSTADLVRIMSAREDMLAAVRWTRANAGAHGIDPGKIAVGGYSAGAVTALLAATTADVPGMSGTPGVSSKVCTALSFAGAGSSLFVDAGDAGAIFFHGDQDRTVPYSEAVATHEAMASAGLPTELVTFPGVGHSLGNAAAIEQQAAEWMVEQVVERPTSCAGPTDPTHPAFVKAVFADFLGRPPSDDDLRYQVDLLESGASRAQLLHMATTSDEWVSGLVRDLYLDTLGRVPDISGWDYWTNEIKEGRRSVASVAAAFYAAPEYVARFEGSGAQVVAAWVTDLYEEILGRTPSSAELRYWADEVHDGGGYGWVARGLYGSLESRRARVAALYDHLLGRAPDTAGLAFWAERVAATGDLALARSLAASPEYRARAVSRFPD